MIATAEVTIGEKNMARHKPLSLSRGEFNIVASTSASGITIKTLASMYTAVLVIAWMATGSWLRRT